MPNDYSLCIRATMPHDWNYLTSPFTTISSDYTEYSLPFSLPLYVLRICFSGTFRFVF